MFLAEDFPMLLAELMCSDGDCDLTFERVGNLTDLELLVCDDCGCCLHVVAVSAHEPVEFEQRVELRHAA